jgi:hypothetical protein
LFAAAAPAHRPPLSLFFLIDFFFSGLQREAQISTVNPDQYCRRFQEFLASILE